MSPKGLSLPGLEDLPTFASSTHNAQMHTDGLPHGAHHPPGLSEGPGRWGHKMPDPFKVEADELG